MQGKGDSERACRAWLTPLPFPMLIHPSTLYLPGVGLVGGRPSPMLGICVAAARRVAASRAREDPREVKGGGGGWVGKGFGNGG